MNTREFVDRYNKLTGLIMQKFAADSECGNIVFSPFSILSILSILADATDGTTSTELKRVLYGELKQEGISEQIQAVREELTRRPDKEYEWIDLYDDPIWDKPIRDRSSHLHTANAVCVRDDLYEYIRPEFKKFLREMHNGILLSSSNISEAMHAWISEMICEDIRALLNEAMSAESILTIVNSVSFDAMWQYPYDDEDVKMGIFHNLDETESNVVMLHNGGNTFVENELATGFVKSFQQCNYSFMALMPKEEGTEALNELINTVDYYDLMQHQQHVILHTMFPEFEISFKKSLKQIIKGLGIQTVFTDHADFSAMSSTPLRAEQLVHQAEIQVDRNGAKAAAATALILCGSCPPVEEKYVIIDRPFVFAIINEGIKIPVFVGVVNHLDDYKETLEKLYDEMETRSQYRSK